MLFPTIENLILVLKKFMIFNLFFNTIKYEGCDSDSDSDSDIEDFDIVLPDSDDDSNSDNF